MNNYTTDCAQGETLDTTVTVCTKESQAEAALRLRVAIENVRWLWRLGKLEAHVAFRIVNELEAAG